MKTRTTAMTRTTNVDEIRELGLRRIAAAAVTGPGARHARKRISRHVELRRVTGPDDVQSPEGALCA
jgi:hypothetical protein